MYKILLNDDAGSPGGEPRSAYRRPHEFTLPAAQEPPFKRSSERLDEIPSFLARAMARFSPSVKALGSGLLWRVTWPSTSHGTRILLAETIIPAGNDPALVKAVDVTMLVVPGGLERTESQYAELLSLAGLRLERVIATMAPISILEARVA